MKTKHAETIAKTLKCSAEDVRALANRANKVIIFKDRSKVSAISTLRSAILDAASSCCGHSGKFEILMNTLVSGATHAKAKHAVLLDKAASAATEEATDDTDPAGE